MIGGERYARALLREVGISNGNRDWLRFWEIGHDHLGDGARVRSGPVQSFAIRDFGWSHASESESVPKADSTRLLLKSFMCLFRTIYMCFSHRDTCFQSPAPSKAHLTCEFAQTCSFTSRPAIPCPVPIHILVKQIFFFVRLASLKIVQICRAPVAPNGCPSAIAPPLGFIFLWSRPSTFMQ